ncbi:MAG: glycoside hydrolase family 2 TIM barrel-domain containing protein [Candidatus Omnitrophota bacterium]
MRCLRIIFAFIVFSAFNISYAETREIIEARGGRVKAVKYDDGTWQLLNNNAPYFIKGVMFSPVRIGESPHEATMRDWMYYDDNNDGVNDIAYQTWPDTNRNNRKDADEKTTGDFQLLKDMGCNTIRIYHAASNNPMLGTIYKTGPSVSLQFDHPINKGLLRELYNNYGIMVIVGNFIGAWTIGSDASWEEGTDYNNPEHRENIKKSVKVMVLDNKDEPYVLMWLLGNENNLGTWTRCNAILYPKIYAKFIGELADMIHQLDPEHPVAVCDGDNFNTLRQYPEHAQGIDIIAYNSYRGKYGFGALWKAVKDTFDRPVFISEYGIFAYNKDIGEEEDFQLEYNKGCWQDIIRNSAQYYNKEEKVTGNSIGGVIFDWVDRWYMDGTPNIHNPGTRSWNSPDGLRHEEWFGVMSMGNGKDHLTRQKRKTYDYFRQEWK